MFTTVFKSIYLKYVNLLLKDGRPMSPFLVLRGIWLTTVTKSKCKRPVSHLNINLNFGKDRSAYRLTQPRKRSSALHHLCTTALPPFTLPCQRVSYNPVPEDSEFSKCNLLINLSQTSILPLYKVHF